MEKLKRALTIFMAISIIAMLYACGGGGDSTPTTQTPTVTTSSISVSGIVSASDSSNVSSSSISKSALNPAISDAIVTILSYDKSGNLIDNVSTKTTEGLFGKTVKVQSTGGSIVVEIFKDGYVKSAITKNYNSLDDLAQGITINQVLDAANTNVIQFTNNKLPLIASADDEFVSIAVVEDKSGNKKIVDAAGVKIAKASNQNIIWQLDVSKDYFRKAGLFKSDNSTVNLVASINNYNPDKPEDMRRFPSEYDDKGNKLVTNGFDFTDIRYDNGSAFVLKKEIAKTAKASSGITYRIKRKIISCESIKNKDGSFVDENKTKAGNQVGFYLFVNGKWVKLGEATLYVNPDQSDNTSISCDDNTKPYAVLTDNDISKDLDFDVRWYNLDIVATGTYDNRFTIKVIAKDSDGNEDNVSGMYLNLYGFKCDDNSLSNIYLYGNTNDKGIYNGSVIYSDNCSGKLSIDNIYYTNPYTYRYEKAENINKSGDNFTFYITKPKRECTNKITLKKDGNLVKNKYFYLFNSQNWIYISAKSDDNGTFTVKTDNSTYEIWIDGRNLDNISCNQEKEVNLPNNKPYAYIYSYTNSVDNGSQLLLYTYSYDPDGDKLTQTIIDNCSGKFDGFTKWTAPAKEGKCMITYTVSDGKDNDSKFVEIEVVKGNRAPVISNITGPTNVKKGTKQNYSARAYDLDGDNLTYTWYLNGDNVSRDNCSNNTCSLEFSADSNTIKLEVSDGKITVYRNYYVYAYDNRAPVITGVSNLSGKKRIGSEIVLSSEGFDPDGDRITIKWTVPANVSIVGSDNSSRVTVKSDTIGKYDIKVKYDDGEKSTERIIIVEFVDNQAPIVNINLSTATPKPGDNVTITCSATDPDGDSIATYKLYFVDNQTVSGAAAPNTYTLSIPTTDTNGKTYTVKCEATDNFTLSPKTGSKTSTITVTTVPTYGNITITNKK